VEPIPETQLALELLTPEDPELAGSMAQAARDLGVAAPTTMGFSIGVVADGITLTYVASRAELRLLDAVQYLGGGPCEDAHREGRPLEFGREHPLDEQSWGLFAQAGAAHGVQSTLSLPILRDGTVIAGVNLYGSRPDTFSGRHDAVADVFGAWAPGAVSNADLSFSTRIEAVRAPGRLRDITMVEMAVGVFVARHAVSPEVAREKLVRSAAQAGISVRALARLVVEELGANGS